MVFMREQRPHIDDEVKRKGNGVVNMHLAQKVGTSVACLRLLNLFVDVFLLGQIISTFLLQKSQKYINEQYILIK